MSQKNETTKCYEYKVKGMHCAACEIAIENKLKKMEGILKADAKIKYGTLEIETSSNESYEQLAEKISLQLKDDGYTLEHNQLKTSSKKNNINFDEWFYALPIAVTIIFLYLIFMRLDIFYFNIVGDNSLIQIFLIGFAASLSTCMALIGGIIISISSVTENLSRVKKYTFHFNFHLGRIIGFFIFGGMLGLIGSLLKPSILFSNILMMLVSLIFLVLGLSYLLPNIFAKYQFRIPKVIGKKILEKPIVSSVGSFTIGALTFFIPCGFTNSVQVLALETGDIVQSSAIMLAFALGSLPVLSVLSFFSSNIFEKLQKNGVFNKIVGILISAFALYYMLITFNKIIF